MNEDAWAIVVTCDGEEFTVRDGETLMSIDGKWRKCWVMEFPGPSPGGDLRVSWPNPQKFRVMQPGDTIRFTFDIEYT